MASESETNILFRLKTHGPQTAQKLAERFDMTVVGIRQHLGSLHEQGLVDHRDEAGKVGRPTKIWQLTETGHAQFPDSHSSLTVELIDSVRHVFGEDGLDRLIQQREKETLRSYRAAMKDTDDLAGKVRALAKQRSAEGYMASVQKQRDGSFLLIENHCPICIAAKSCQGFCRSELELFQAALGKDVSVKRSEHLLSGARRCAYAISPA